MHAVSIQLTLIRARRARDVSKREEKASRSDATSCTCRVGGGGGKRRKKTRNRATRHNDDPLASRRAAAALTWRLDSVGGRLVSAISSNRGEDETMRAFAAL